MKRLAGFALVLTLAACGEKPAATVTAVEAVPAAPVANLAEAPPAPAAADPWVGRWNGPEGTFLQIDERGEGEYHLTLKDTLDSQGEYDAEVAATGLSFTRGGKVVVVKPGTGPQTGMKWLAEKKDCLILQDGQEGYCRD